MPLELVPCDLQRAGHDFLRAVPVLFDLKKILASLLALFIALDHAKLFRHVDGEHCVVNRSSNHALTLVLNSLNFERVEIFALGEPVLAHSREPVFISRLHFEKIVQVSRRDSRAVIVVSDLD